MIHEAEELRSSNNIHDPDPRTENLVVIDGKSHFPRSITIEDQYGCISRFILNKSVPEEIVVHFETAKNLYLYAWHVYRFYPVAEQQAFATLEFALRLRLHEYVEQFKKDKCGREPTLHSLLKHAKETQILKNDLFPSKYRWATQIAKDRFCEQMYAKAREQGLSEFEYDDSHVIPTEEDLNQDWLSNFIKVIPKIRNDLAHGSSSLRHSVVHTFDVVSSMINQLYPVVI